MASVLHWAHVAPPADPRVDRRCCLQALERKVMGGPCAWPRGLLADAVNEGGQMWRTSPDSSARPPTAPCLPGSATTRPPAHAQHRLSLA